MKRTFPAIVFAALAPTACGDSASTPDDSTDPGGGKADDVRQCAEGRTCLQFQAYEVLFTNPVCATYAYDQPVEAVRGDDRIATKPKNVYCTGLDSDAQFGRQRSPQTRILDWLGGVGEGDEVFLAYLSFSDRKVADALCEAEARGAEVTFVLDKMSSAAETVEDCGGDILIRGHQGSVQFAHNKILMINPRGAGPADDNDEFLRLSFGSGNMSSGTHLHHENWQFLEVERDSFFVESHLCLMDALLDARHTDGKTAFKEFMNSCRAEIEQPPEDDMKPFFIPVRDDAKAITALMESEIAKAETIDVGAHRISYRQMVEALSARLRDADRPFHLRLVADDDLYWLDPLPPSEDSEVGPNTRTDLDKLEDLRAADGDRGRFEEKYLETNHAAHLLHHNKYLIFNGMPERDSLIVGSSNLTGTGFNDNLENLYWTDIPEVVDAFKAQFELFWDGEGPLPDGMDVAPMATAREDMPLQLITVSDPTDPGGDPDPDPDPDRACGLRIAEVFYDPQGRDDGKEYVKLYNSCDEDLALDGMSLAWAGSSWMHAGLDLDGVVGAKTCVLVGGEGGALDFSPDLQNSGSTADGVALFDMRASAVGGSTVPVDSVIYGGSNGSDLLDASGDVGAPNVGDALAGQSLLLERDGVWTISDSPQPDACPEF